MLTDNESMIVRMALATFEDVLADGLGWHSFRSTQTLLRARYPSISVDARQLSKWLGGQR